MLGALKECSTHQKSHYVWKRIEDGTLAPETAHGDLQIR